MPRRPYCDDEIAARIAAELPLWQADGSVIVRAYRTADFAGSMLVANAIAHLAEAAWHHPDLVVAWGRVEVRLTTHSAGGVTDQDFELAAAIERSALWRPAAEPPGKGRHRVG